MAQRTPVALVCLSLFAVSCHVAETPLPTDITISVVTAEPSVADPAVEEVVAYFENRRSSLTGSEIRSVAETIVAEARRHDLDPRLVLAVIHIESRANPYAVSPVGAMGLMQIMPPTGEELADDLELPWIGMASLFDPHVNVRMGVAYLRWLADRYDGNTKMALAAYNWGPGRIDRKLRRGSPMPREYVDSVLEAYQAPRPTHSQRPTRSKTAVHASYTPPRA